MISQLVNLQYCYEYVVNQIPVVLLLYSHIPTAIIALLFGAYLLYKTRTLPSFNLFIVSLFFALWCFADLGSWFVFMGSAETMFTWSLVDLFSLIFFLFSYYFLYTFITEKDLPLWQKILGILIIIPTAAWTFFGSNLILFDGNTCEAWENESITKYLFYAETIIVLATASLTVYVYRKDTDAGHKREIMLAGVGVIIFLASFLSSTWLASILVNYEAWADSAYNYEIYGLFGMPVMLVYLGYLIVRYKAFNLKVFGAQALVFALVALIASELLFVRTLVNQILTGITLLLSFGFGLVLIRSVKREVQLREDLQVANEGQADLLHIINHQIKGYMTKARYVFDALINDGDYGPIPENTKGFVKQGYDSVTEGVQFVTEFLNAANIEKGTYTYQMEPVDFKAIVEEQSKAMGENAKAKGLSYSLEIKDGAYQMTADKAQLGQAVRNLIDNSIRYTPGGSINVQLSMNNGKALFTVKDTGVGLSEEVKPKLFTKGGRDKDSQKININSTGFGLAFVKGVAVAHKGRVWADSSGVGKGSTFSMELPLS